MRTRKDKQMMSHQIVIRLSTHLHPLQLQLHPSKLLESLPIKWKKVFIVNSFQSIDLFRLIKKSTLSLIRNTCIRIPSYCNGSLSTFHQSHGDDMWDWRWRQTQIYPKSSKDLSDSVVLRGRFSFLQNVSVCQLVWD